ncbi:Hypothetical predicted protein [Pelobates cultripes]|uniref:Uncharacterized protein n=1 Tax=Pelobates cultripes TaxID=61616 RepID=A0AAD1RQ48_PELCU|nr:Hypothetical predicted protein [Pelobates cultripes]
MGRNHRTEHSQNPRDPQPGPQQGTMDGFLHPPRGNDGGPDSPSPAPRSPVSTAGGDPATLERISDELRTMAVAMATKADLLTLTTTIQDALRAEMAGIRAQVSTHANRIESLEATTEAQNARLAASDTAIARQGDLLLHMRRHLEDLDNRGRRCNIRIRGIPEAERGENLEELLTSLFKLILQANAPQSRSKGEDRDPGTLRSKYLTALQKLGPSYPT